MNHGPLTGVKVLEMAGIGPGPFCGMLLADLGADVVRVDRPGGAGMTTLVPWEQDLLNRGKRSVEADLRTSDGVDRVLMLADRADVFFECWRPGVAERLGIGPDVCLERNTRLVYGRLTGWGQDGPLAHTAGHDIDYIAPTGALHAIGDPRRPQPPLNLLGDFAGGSLYLAVGILAALREVAVSGRGQVVDAAMVDGVSHMMTMFHGLLAAGAWRDERGVNLIDGGAPFYGVYPTSDGGFMAVGALEPRFYAEFVKLLGLPPGDADGQADPKGYPALRARIAETFASRTREEWTAVFEGSDACVAPVATLAEAQEHPHLAARGTFVELDGVVQPAPAPRFSATPGAIRRTPSVPGQNTDEVLADWLA